MNNIIVTMTSYGSRIKTAHKAIESIWDGDLRPDKVVLWLAEDEFLGKKARNQLSIELKELEESGRVMIRYCGDIRSYKKLVPSLKAFPDDLLVTADDDLIYHKDWLSHIIQEYQNFQHKRMIYSSIAYQVSCTEAGDISTQAIPIGPYETENLMISSGAGVLYPPHVLDPVMEEINKGDFMELSPTSDESYISMLATSHGIPIISLGKDFGEMYDEIPNTEEVPLWRKNTVNRNQRLTELAKHFSPDYYQHLVLINGKKLIDNILVSMTSWKARIGNVHKVIESILKGSLFPHKIVLNLSEVEFPGEEKELPDELMKLVKAGYVEINWVGENTKSFKKLIPTLYKYPEYLVVTADDDLIYPKDFLKNLYETYVQIKRQHPITGGDSLIHNRLYTYYGGGTLSRLADYGRILRGIYEGYAKPVVLENGLSFDDPVYTYAAYLKGTRFILSKEPICKVFAESDDSLSADPISKSGKLDYEKAYVRYKRRMIAFIKANYPEEYQRYRDSIYKLEEEERQNRINLQKMELNPWVQHYNKFY